MDPDFLNETSYQYKEESFIYCAKAGEDFIHRESLVAIIHLTNHCNIEIRHHSNSYNINMFINLQLKCTYVY